jgi:hypothetical protein
MPPRAPKPPAAKAKPGGAARSGVAGAVGGTVMRGFGLFAQAGFTIHSWFDIFAQYFPHIKHTVSVKAQGGSKTQANRVVHTALAIAFGCMRQTRIGKIELNLTLDHTSNAVELEFAVSSMAQVEALEALSNLIGFEEVASDGEDKDKDKNRPPSLAEKLTANAMSLVTLGIVSPETIIENGRDVEEYLQKLKREAQEKEAKERGDHLKEKLGDVQNKNPGQVPGIDRKGGPNDAGIPPDPPDNMNKQEDDEPASWLLRRALAVYRTVSDMLGQGVIWRLGRYEIRGGKAPGVLNKDKPNADKNRGLVGIIKNATDQVTGANAFSQLEGKVILTRSKAKNPQMPTGLADSAGGLGFGTDLRTLVAQVLHDPGVRPAIPLTDRGPQPVRVEEVF